MNNYFLNFLFKLFHYICSFFSFLSKFLMKAIEKGFFLCKNQEKNTKFKFKENHNIMNRKYIITNGFSLKCI